MRKENFNLNVFSNKLLPIVFLALLIIFLVPSVKADFVLDTVQFDPVIISSGDTVDVVIQYHERGIVKDNIHVGDSSYEFRTQLVADDTLTQQYVVIQDAQGDDMYGTIYSGDRFYKKYRIKVSQSAPPGTYEFKLVGTWFHNGIPENSSTEMKFKMDVKKEGISLSVANLVSEPRRVRSGDKNVMLSTELFNSGEKSAKNVKIKLDYPSGITSSYTNNNQLTLGVIEPMKSQTVQFYVDTEKILLEGVYLINYTLDYQDTDSNYYTKTGSFPFVVKKKPNVEIVSFSGNGLAGDDAKLHVVVKNVGEEKAEAVDVRLIKQSSQPFEMDVRSAYIGQLKSGETGEAVFDIAITREAEIKEHKFNVAIRAKGDTSEGDSNVYTFSDSVSFEVSGKQKNYYPYYALALFGLILIILGVKYGFSSDSKKGKK